MAAPTTDRACAHCGLPAHGHGSGPSFCCGGCAWAYRLLGDQDAEGVAAAILARLGIGAFFGMTVMMLSLLLYAEPVLGDIEPEARAIFRGTMLALSVPVVALLGVPFFLAALGELKRGVVSTDALIAIGVGAAFGVSAWHTVRGGPIYFDTAAMLLVLLTLGRLLETGAKDRAGRLIRGLLDLAAPTARVIRDDGEREVPPEEVAPGDRVRVKPGERIPVDGTILEGRATIDEAAFTGESLPVVRGPGERVHGGTVSADGQLVIRAEAAARDSLLAQMADLVDEARRRRAPLEQRVDRIAGGFVALVLLLAAAAVPYGVVVHDSLAHGAMSGLAVLVVACPCALGLATPLVHRLALGLAARHGAVLRSAEALGRLRGCDTVLLDKTGTLTRGRLERVAVEPLAAPADEALGWLAALEQGSEHPIAKAVLAAATPLGTVTELRATAGEGVVGEVSRHGITRQVRAGKPEFCGLPPVEARPGETVVAVAWDGQPRAILRFRDRLRPEAAEVVEALAARGLKVMVVSGDRPEAVEAVTAELRLDGRYAGMSPDEKAALVAELRAAGRTVMMVGDGINDSPALAAADVGVAMSGGTELAREASEVTLIGDDLTRLPALLDLAAETDRRVNRNLAWAFGYNLLLLAIAFLGWLHPLLAAALMLASSFVVLGNSLAMLRTGDRQGAAGSGANGAIAGADG